MPPSPSRSLYDLLGVSRNASQDEIKKRYRELARQHHPDVNPGNASAARVFAEITAAYKTLSDADARGLYDAEIALAERRAAAAAAKSGAAARPAATPSAPGAAPQAARQPPTPQTSANEAAAQLVRQAQAALARMKFVEARDLAQQSLRVRRTAEGYEVLGDVYRLQGRSDQAMDMYTMSLQINPRNSRVMERLERLARSSGGGGRGGAGRTERRYDTASTSPFPGARPSGGGGGGAAAVVNDKQPIALLLTSVVGYSLVFFLVLYQWFYGGEPPTRPLTPLPFVSTWNGSLLWVLPASGFLLGVTMAVTQFIRRIDDELIFTAGSRSNPVPVGVLLIALSLVSFWAAALLHLILAAIQEARVDSILRVFGGVALLVLFLTAVYEPGRSQVFLFGGNVAFLAFLAGWALGDIFRPDL